MRLPFLLWLSVRLQDATNWLFLRHFTVELGVLKNRGLAVVLTTNRVFGTSQKLLMDIRSFLHIAELMVETDEEAYEKSGFTIPKKDKMDDTFTIPSWAFPKAYYEVLLCAEHIIATMKKTEEAMERVAGYLKEVGVAPEEIDKLRKGITVITKPEGEEKKEENK